MDNIVIFGAPGSGKGTYSAVLKKHFGYEHISTGDVLRAEIKAETELGKIAKEFVDQGQLIPDDLMIDMLAKVYDARRDSLGVIFDGFPRTIKQAKALKEMLMLRGERITITINLIVKEEELMRRLIRRAEIEGRADDNEDTIKKRFNVYNTQTAPLLEWFTNEGLLCEFTYNGSSEKMEQNIIAKVASL
ncbi:MAG TPA: adenylate kinase [Bacteroidaceae bacterium]|nr:adenylate kinase [Bacteroidaceae bacterium]